jgi:hypothetical protein
MSELGSHGPVSRLVDYAVAGTIGQLIVRGFLAARPMLGPAARRAAVAGLAGGMLTGRRLAAAAEEARLRIGDLVAEAHAQIGEPAPAPTARPAGNDHEH